MQIINPATEEIITDLPTDSDESLLAKFKILKKGQKKWQRISLKSRVEILKKFSELLIENTEELALTLTNEMGKPLQQARNEINGAVNRIKFFVENSQKYLKNETIGGKNGTMHEKIVYEPYGVLCNISAWNYPYLVGVNVFVPALIAGNAVFYKPSEFATLTGLKIEKYLKLAGVPDDVFQVAIGAKEVGEYLLTLPLDGYYFTGSYKTGKHIYQKVAPKMIPCQLELGGKDPLYVADDVENIPNVAAATADGVFYNNGQSCCAVERIYVHETIYDQYVEEFLKEVKTYKLGKPTDDGVYLGAISRKDQLDFLEFQVKDALKKGAKLLCGGKKVENSKGFYFEPTILIDVTHKMSVMKDESFGPIIGIMKVKDDKNALKLMNDSEFGLTASVYSANQKRAEKF